jgi:serine/threonine protein kinase
MEDLDLSQFGWDGLVIPSDLVIAKSNIPSWKDLKILREPILLLDVPVYFTQKFFTLNSEKYVPAYIKGELDDDNGGYSSIYKGKRAIFKPISKNVSGFVQMEKCSAFSTVCIKAIPLNISLEEDRSPAPLREKYYEEEINAILYEVYIHTLLSKTLVKANHPYVVPYLHEVVASSINNPKSPSDFSEVWVVMEYINGSTLQKFLIRSFIKKEIYRNETLLIDILLQLAYYLQILQSNLRFNHRDLKLNNVFVRFHTKADDWKCTLPIFEGYTCINNIMMIDFGFSCIECDDISGSPHGSMLGAGSWFKKEDDCLKCGRDIGQFLYSLHATFPLTEYISSDLFELLYSLVVTEHKGKSINLFHGFDDHGESLGSIRPAKVPFNDGIYRFLRQHAVDIPGCAPKNILENLYNYNKRRRVEKI